MSSSGMVGDAGSDGEQSEPQPFRLPPAGVVVGQGEHLELVSRVVSDFTVSFWDNRVCLLLRRLCCVPVMSRD
jgi:hypothetical protein